MQLTIVNIVTILDTSERTQAAALLELALTQWAVRRAVERGFMPVAPPDMARRPVVAGRLRCCSLLMVVVAYVCVLCLLVKSVHFADYRTLQDVDLTLAGAMRTSCHKHMLLTTGT